MNLNTAENRMIRTENRIRRQINECQDDPPSGCLIQYVDPNNPFQCIARLIGPEDSPYAGGMFLLSIHFSQDHPFRPPKCKFKTKIYHPGINCNGAFCLRLLKEQWHPRINIAMVLTETLQLLIHPQGGCVHVPEIQQECNNNKRLFQVKARQWTMKFAKKK